MQYGPSRSTNLDHEHEFVKDDVDIIVDEDVWFNFSCGWIEVTGSYTSDKHDETFYGEGAECGATKQIGYSVLIDGEPIDSDVLDDVEVEAVYEWLEENIAGNPAYSDGPDRYVDVDPRYASDERVIHVEDVDVYGYDEPQDYTITLVKHTDRIDGEGEFY